MVIVYGLIGLAILAIVLQFVMDTPVLKYIFMGICFLVVIQFATSDKSEMKHTKALEEIIGQ